MDNHPPPDLCSECDAEAMIGESLCEYCYRDQVDEERYELDRDEQIDA